MHVAGSILDNILLVLGVSIVAGGLRRDRQFFEARAASAQSLMLLLATVALIMPAFFELISGPGLPDSTARAVDFPANVKTLSVGVAVILLVSYAAGLLFSLKTHRSTAVDSSFTGRRRYFMLDWFHLLLMLA